MESIQSLQTGDSAAAQQEAGDQKVKRPAVRHSRDSKRVLKEWFTSHSTWPYPTEQEKQSLSDETGLSVRQVSYWFVNTRRRNSKKLTRIAPNLDADLTAESLANHLQPGEDAWGGMTPLDRWRHSPPEQEPAPLHAICRAVSDGIATSSGKTPGLVSSFTPTIDNARSRVGSVSSFDFSTSAPSSEASGNSNSSGSISSFGSQSSRRSRRKPWRSAMRKRGLANDPSKQGDRRPFQCTFCTDTFKSRYDWTRHEGSLHLVLERWACLPFGPKVLDQAGGPPKCALCDMLNPTDDHIQSHYATECLAKPLNTRVFFRKDHLRQHLRLVHGIDKMLPEMDKWKSQILKINSRCGFCGATFSLWSDRNDHLAEHFRSGTLMKDWKGDRGLDAAVSLLVENAMPPYLIGTESNDPDPFSASKGGSKTMQSMVNGQLAPTSFAALTAKLGDYVRAAKASGVAITDDLLRNEARMILYGDADPWNHTPADNAEWLRMFKIGYCLGPDVCPELTSTCPTNADQPGQNAIGPLASQSDVDPFTTVKIQHAMSIQQLQLQFNITDSSTFAEDVYLAPNTDVAVPWPWQMPECLAEFRQMVEQSGLPDPAQTLTFDTTDFGQDVQPLNLNHDEPEGFGTNTEAIPWEYTYGLDDMPFPFDFDFTLD